MRNAVNILTGFTHRPPAYLLRCRRRSQIHHLFKRCLWWGQWTVPYLEMYAKEFFFILSLFMLKRSLQLSLHIAVKQNISSQTLHRYWHITNPLKYSLQNSIYIKTSLTPTLLLYIRVNFGGLVPIVRFSAQVTPAPHGWNANIKVPLLLEIKIIKNLILIQ